MSILQCEWLLYQVHYDRTFGVHAVVIKKHIGRIVVQSLGSDHATTSSTLLSALLGIKQAVSGTSCAAVVTIQPAFFSSSTVSRACHIADGLIGMEPVETDSDVYGYLGDASSSACLLQLKKTPGRTIIVVMNFVPHCISLSASLGEFLVSNVSR